MAEKIVDKAREALRGRVVGEERALQQQVEVLENQ